MDSRPDHLVNLISIPGIEKIKITIGYKCNISLILLREFYGRIILFLERKILKNCHSCFGM
jgi:hypothetical protein